jgi:glycosyltransferase involved in cell wall biosynthesis
MYAWLKETIASGAVGLVHSHGMWMMPAVYPGRACRAGKEARLVVSPHGTFSQWAFASGSPLKRVFWPLFQRPAIAECACFHATAASEYSDIRRMGFNQPIAVIPSGIDIPSFLPKTEGPVQTLLFLGRLHPVKGLEWLLPAWAALEDRFPNWKLRIVGSDAHYLRGSDYSMKLKNLATDLKLERVEFVGELRGNEKLTAFREADLFVLPSHTENFGVAVAEALAAGTPALVSKGAPWGGLVANECGWWVDLGVEALVEGLRKAMSLSPQELMQMGHRGRDWMAHEFSWPRVGEAMAQTYAWLTTGGQPPGCVRLD